MPFGRKSPLEALALPGVMLAYKYSQFRQRRREAASRRVTERELSALHHKIDKLLSKLEESEPDPPTSQEDECVICINARATMQTSPCGHRVVCRRCFVKTIQSAVAQRLLPLRCVICRARVNRLTSSSGTWRIQESASSYSMGAKSWASAGVTAGGVTASASSYSMNDAHSGHHAFHQTTLHHTNGGAVPRFPRSPHARVTQSDSLYSMSSTGSSTLSGYSHTSAYSKTSSISSSGPCSPASPLSPGLAQQTTGTSAAATTSSVLNNHLAPPSPTTQQQQHHHHHLSISHSHHHHSLSSPSGSSAGSLSPREPHTHHHGSCPSGCSGAVPRKPLNTLQHGTLSNGGPPAPLPPSLTPTPTPTLTHTYPGRRYTKGRLMDLQNRLPPIKEFRSPAKVPHPSPVHISNPRFRYASYTKTSTQELAPLLHEPPSPPRRPMNIQMSCAALSGLAPPPLKAGGAKICPLSTKASLPKNAYMMPKDKKPANGSSSGGGVGGSSVSVSTKCGSVGATALMGTAKGQIANGKLTTAAERAANTAKSTASGTSCSGTGSGAGRKQTLANGSACSTHASASSRGFPLFSSSNHKEKADNKKNESVERKKREEKLKMKAEKEARKEEKRLAKEEERLAKLLAKEEKKKGKKEAKELLLANDGNNKK